jgi:hypothetical protein
VLLRFGGCGVAFALGADRGARERRGAEQCDEGGDESRRASRSRSRGDLVAGLGGGGVVGGLRHLSS